MSVLDTIKEAEQKAIEAKAEASRQAKEAVSAAQDGARAKTREIRDHARQEADALLVQARSRMADESREALDAGRKQDEEAARAARLNLSRAVSFIVERIEKQ